MLFLPQHSSISGLASGSVRRPHREKWLLPDRLIGAWSGSPVITIGTHGIIATFGSLDDGRIHRGHILFGLKAAGRGETMSGCTIQADGRRKHPEDGDGHSCISPPPLTLRVFPSSMRRGKGWCLAFIYYARFRSIQNVVPPLANFVPYI